MAEFLIIVLLSMVIGTLFGKLLSSHINNSNNKGNKILKIYELNAKTMEDMVTDMLKSMGYDVKNIESNVFMATRKTEKLIVISEKYCYISNIIPKMKEHSATGIEVVTIFSEFLFNEKQTKCKYGKFSSLDEVVKMAEKDGYDWSLCSEKQDND